jgi:hypothetical protein
MGSEGARAKFSFKPRATLLLKWRVNTSPRLLGAGRSILGSNVVKSPSARMSQPRGPTMTGSVAISVADLQPPTGVVRGSCRPGTSCRYLSSLTAAAARGGELCEDFKSCRKCLSVFDVL